MKITLFFGSFNPIHIGHLIIAEHVLNFTGQDQVWLVCTPQNPDKEKKSLLGEQFRLDMLHLAVKDNPRILPSDIEFHLPRPSYTVNTLLNIREKYPQHQFSILMGEDNLQTLPNWQGSEYILKNFPIYVYPRLVHGDFFYIHKWASQVVYLKDAPMMRISASFIRSNIKNKKSIRYLVPEIVEQYIDKMGFYL